MTRLDRLPAPPLAPAACLSCGSHTDPQGFFDLGPSIELYGAPYLCATCVIFMAKGLHMVGPDVIHNARQEMADARRRAGNAEAEVRKHQMLLGHDLARMLERAYATFLEEERAREPDGAAAAGSSDGSGAARPRRRRDGRSKSAQPGDGAIPGPDAGDFGTPSGPLPEPAAGAKP